MKNNSQIVRKNILSRLRKISIDYDVSSQITPDDPRKSFTKEVKVKKFKKQIVLLYSLIYLIT